MSYIDWFSLKKEKVVQSKTKIDPEDLVWQDLITNTKFYISKKDYDSIVEQGLNHLEKIKGDIDEVGKYFATTPISKKIPDPDKDLFPQLPYIVKKGAKTHRLADHYILRTGLLYALYGEKYSKEEIRKHGLLCNVFNRDFLISQNSFLKEVISELDKFLTGHQYNLEDIVIDLVKGGAVKIKQYFLETNNIKNIRGASIILDEINNDVIPEYIEKMYIPESIVYAGGGNVLAVLPQGEGKSLAQMIERIYEERAVTVQNVAVSKSFLINALAKNYKESMRELEELLEKRQMFKLDWRDNPVEGNLKFPFGKENYEDFSSFIKGVAEICEHCNIRTAKLIFDNERLCLSCGHKTKKGKEGRRGFRKRYLDYIRNFDEALYDKYKNKINIKSVEDLKDDNNSISLIYGDGNNMGKVIQNVESLTQIRFFSDVVENTIASAVYESIYNVLKEPKFEIIAMGGDDIIIILPGNTGIEIGRLIGERFDENFKNLSEEKNTLTMSLGITLSNYTKPIQYLFDLAQQLLKNAKKKAREVDIGTMDIVGVVNDGRIGYSLANSRKEMKKEDTFLTLKPYTWEQVKAIQQAIQKLKDKGLRSKCYSFRDSIYNLTIEEAKLYYLFELSKKEKRKVIQQVLSDLSLVFGGNEEVMNIEINGKRYTPWIDIVELWDYITKEATPNG